MSHFLIFKCHKFLKKGYWMFKSLYWFLMFSEILLRYNCMYIGIWITYVVVQKNFYFNFPQNQIFIKEFPFWQSSAMFDSWYWIKKNICIIHALLILKFSFVIYLLDIWICFKIIELYWRWLQPFSRNVFVLINKSSVTQCFFIC